MEALENWKEEKRSAFVYKALSKIETNPVHKQLFIELSGMAEKQATIWEQQFHAAHITTPVYHPDKRTKIVIWLVRCLGVKALRIALAAMKIRGMSIYQGQQDTEHPFAHISGEIEDHRHHGVRSGNNIRAAIFGMSDGLLSNVSLILGIAGASNNYSFILLSGIAGLLAGACSMGAGEYVSVRSQRDMLEYQLALEKSELELYPEEEAAELALIYQARGIPKKDAERISKHLIQNSEKALDILAREELGINPHELVSPWGAALSSFFSFSLGAFIPLLPFIFSTSQYNLYFTIGFTGMALFGLGAIMSLFTQRSSLLSGIRMLLIGTAAGGLTYFIGSMLGVNTH